MEGKARWVMTISLYDFIIRHRPGRSNPADGPSRHPHHTATSQVVNELLLTLQKKLGIPLASLVDGTTSEKCEKILCSIRLISKCSGPQRASRRTHARLGRLDIERRGRKCCHRLHRASDGSTSCSQSCRRGDEHTGP